MSTQIERTLSHFSYEAWNHETSWSNAFGKPMGDLWLQDKLDLLARHISTLPLSRGGNYLEPLKDLSNSTISILGGRLSPPLRELVGLCIEHNYPLPAVRLNMDSNAEPCGPIVVRHSLSPEWIRHFLGAFYERKEFEKALAGRKFFPYENRDHLVHTLICLFIGEVALGMPIEKRLRDAVCGSRATRGSCRPITLFGALAEMYRAQHSDWFDSPMLDTEPEVWLRRAWIAIALWHDAGYDTATWYLLTAREFRHCQAVDRIMPAFWEQFAEILGYLVTEIGILLPSDLQQAMIRAQQDFLAQKSPYEVLWHLEGCNDQDPRTRSWGRLHALFSAHEFLNCMAPSERQRPDVKHIAAAIAEHHEQVHLSADSLDWDALWSNFERNPLAALLAFTDFLAGFERVKVTGASPFITPDIGSSAARMSFDLDMNSAPLWTTRDPNRGLTFFRGRHNQRRFPDRFSLWAAIDKADDDPPKKPSPLGGRHCKIGGCMNVTP